jgi:serine/threonine-protein kinase
MGVLLYEMLAGRPPFKGDTAVSVAYQHVSEQVSLPSEHNPEITPELDQVVLHALAKDREERFQTAEEFREHLMAAVRGESLPKTGFTPKTTVSPLQEALPTEVIGSVDPEDFFKEIGVEYTTGEPTTSIKLRERTSKDQPSAKLLWGIGSGVAVTLVGLIIWLIALGGAFTPVDPNNTGGIEVADISGASYEDGSKVLEEQGFLVLRILETSDTVKEGVVIKTDPPAGIKLPSRSTIEVYVSSGQPEASVPFLEGLTEAEAKEALEEAGLVLGGITPANSATIAKGAVIESSPEANSDVKEGSTVKLLVSDGQVLVPPVISLSALDARRAMEAPDVGFTVVIESPACSGGTVGSVIASQSVPAGLAEQKQTVTLTLKCTPATVAPAPVAPAPVAPAPVAPGAPGAPTATAGDGQATVQISAPTTGGSPVSYTVTANPGGATCSITAPATSCTVTGLTNGTAYTFSSTATNAAGTSAVSASSSPVTPSTP